MLILENAGSCRKEMYFLTNPLRQFFVQDAPVVTERYIKSSEWDLVHVDSVVNTVKYKCCPHPYQDIALKFIIHRRPLYYIFNVIIPCIILMCLVLFSFYLPPESGERITIVITVLLAFTVILQVCVAPFVWWTQIYCPGKSLVRNLWKTL